MNLTKISKYQIISELGSGGMATVYLALDTILERKIALKIMSDTISNAAGFQNGFIDEARIVAKLEHPHIVKIYDVGVEEQKYFMAMEYLSEGTLKDLLKKETLSLNKSLKIIQQLASALSYAHKQGYIHRDIKPANILFRSNDDITLADFGIAKLDGVSSELTRMGVITGTPYYMPPEQAKGEGVDQRSDLYSLGVVFYEMLTNKKPFSGANPIEISYQHIHANIPRLEGEARQFQKIIDKSLAKDPKQRYQTVEQFSKDLSELLNKEKTVLFSGNNVDNKIINKSSKKNKFFLFLMVFIFLCFLAGSVAYYIKIDLKQKEIEAKILADKINGHLSSAKDEAGRNRFFDHSAWSEGCKLLLIDTFGPYEPNNSSEWHYQEIIKLQKTNDFAQQELAKLNNKKYIEFSNCDAYQRKGVDNSEIDDLFKN